MIALDGGLAGSQVAGGFSIPTAGPLRSSSESRVLTAARGPDGITRTHPTVASLAVAAVSPSLTDMILVFAGVKGSARGSMGGRSDDCTWFCFFADAGIRSRLRAGMRSGMHSGAGMCSGMHSGVGMRSGMHSGAGMRSRMHSGTGMRSGMHSGAGKHSGSEMHSGAGLCSEADGGVISRC